MFNKRGVVSNRELAQQRAWQLFFVYYRLWACAFLARNKLIVGGPDQARLLRKKFVDDDYQVTSRPVANDSDTLVINFGLSLLQIRDVVSAVHFVANYFLLCPVLHIGDSTRSKMLTS